MSATCSESVANRRHSSPFCLIDYFLSLPGRTVACKLEALHCIQHTPRATEERCLDRCAAESATAAGGALHLVVGTVGVVDQ